MKTKQEFINELGMTEARRLGFADKHDQLLQAARDLSEEIEVYGIHIADEYGKYGRTTALGYLRETLKEFTP